MRYSHYLQVNFVSTGDDEVSKSWMGYCESRVRGVSSIPRGSSTVETDSLVPSAVEDSEECEQCVLLHRVQRR